MDKSETPGGGGRLKGEDKRQGEASDEAIDTKGSKSDGESVQADKQGDVKGDSKAINDRIPDLKMKWRAAVREGATLTAEVEAAQARLDAVVSVEKKQKEMEKKGEEIQKLDESCKIENSVLRKMLGFTLEETGDESDQQANPNPTPFLFARIPNKPFAFIMDHISTKDKLRLAQTHHAVYQRMWNAPPADPNPDVFKSVILSDISRSLKDCDTAFDKVKAEAFTDFLHAVKNILQKLSLPSPFLTCAGPDILLDFPDLKIKTFQIKLEDWRAVSYLVALVFPKIPDIRNLDLQCDTARMLGQNLASKPQRMYNIIDDTEMNNARSGVLADAFQSMATNCPNIQRLRFEWYTNGVGVGPQAERAMLRLLPQLNNLYALDHITYMSLSPKCIRAALALPSIQASLQEFIGGHEQDVMVLAQCTNLRFVQFSIPFRHNAARVQRAFSGLSKVNHIHLTADVSANDSCLMKILGDPTRNLTNLSLKFRDIDNSGENAVKRAISSNPRLQVLTLFDYKCKLNDSSLAAVGTLSALRVIAVYSPFALTGSFLRHLTPENHPDLRLVLIRVYKKADESALNDLRSRFGRQLMLAVDDSDIRDGPFRWFTNQPLPDHLSDRDRIWATVGQWCPSATCCVSQWLS